VRRFIGNVRKKFKKKEDTRIGILSLSENIYDIDIEKIDNIVRSSIRNSIKNIDKGDCRIIGR